MRTTEAVARPQNAGELEQARYNWLTTSECGRIAGGAKNQTVREWIRAGRLRALNISPGRKVPEYRVRQEDLEAFIAENMNG